MELKATWEKDNIGPTVKKNMDKLGGVVRDAMREAAEETAAFMEAAVADDIEAAGNFGDRWQEMFHADVSETQRTFRVETEMRPEGPPMVYWPVFEYGATIKPKNASGYLWLPFAGAAGTDVWPRAYEGDLFRTTSKKGTPLLGDVETKEWKYFGLAEVTIPKKFHIAQIVREEAQKARVAFRRILSEMRSGNG
jgi:hypothetical protein